MKTTIAIVSILTLLSAGNVFALEGTATQHSSPVDMSAQRAIATSVTSTMGSTMNPVLYCQTRNKMYFPNSTDPSKDARGCVTPNMNAQLQACKAIGKIYNPSSSLTKDANGCVTPVITSRVIRRNPNIVIRNIPDYGWTSYQTFDLRSIFGSGAVWSNATIEVTGQAIVITKGTPISSPVSWCFSEYPWYQGGGCFRYVGSGISYDGLNTVGYAAGGGNSSGGGGPISSGNITATVFTVDY